MTTYSTLIFYLLAGLACFFSLATVLARNILHAAVYLMALLTVTAGLYLVIGADFLAGVQLLVYVGGIVVLLVFAVMLTHTDDVAQERPTPLRLVFGILASVGFFAVTYLGLLNSPFSAARELPVPTHDGARSIGRSLLDVGAQGYVLPFEVISLLLLAALIAGIVIAGAGKKSDEATP